MSTLVFDIRQTLEWKVDVCLISEIKTNKSSSNQQFKVNGYKTIQRDRDSFEGGLIFQVNEHNSRKVLIIYLLSYN